MLNQKNINILVYKILWIELAFDYKYYAENSEIFFLKLIREQYTPDVIISINRKGTAVLNDIYVNNQDIFSGIKLYDIEIKKEKSGLSVYFTEGERINSKNILIFDDFMMTGDTINKTKEYLTTYSNSIMTSALFSLIDSPQPDFSPLFSIDNDFIVSFFSEWTANYIGRLGLDRFSKYSIILRCQLIPTVTNSILSQILNEIGVSWTLYQNLTRENISSFYIIKLKKYNSLANLYLDHRNGLLDIWITNNNMIYDKNKSTCNLSGFLCMKEFNRDEIYPSCPICALLHIFNDEIREIITNMKKVLETEQYRFEISNFKCDHLMYTLDKKEWTDLRKILNFI